MTNTKKKHGNKMKLMSAIGMLTVSAAMLVSSTFAWFSMNKQVTASTMHIEAKSDNPYLLISKTSATANDFATTVDITNSTTKQLKLTTPLNTGLSATTDFTTYYESASAASATAVPAAPTTTAGVKWGYAVSSNPAEVQNTNIPTLIATNSEGDYYQAQDLWIKLNDESANATNLTAACTITPGSNSLDDSIRVLMVTDAGEYAIFDKNGVITTKSKDGDAILAATLTSKKTNPATAGTVEHIRVFLYFDGVGSDSYTNNATNLSDVTFAFTFTVADPADETPVHDQPTP